jgi:putative ABC transport system substrate-binding protein
MIKRQAGAVVVRPFPLAFENRDKILALAEHHKIPASYAQAIYVYEGGLMSYGPGPTIDSLVIKYVARILKGEKPADRAANRLPACYQLKDR